MYNNINFDNLQYLFEKLDKDFKKSYRTRRILYDNLMKNAQAETAQRLIECGKYITVFKSEDKENKLMNRCKQRFCPTCEKYNALERFFDVKDILNNNSNEGYLVYHYIFTVRSCTEERLKDTIKGLNKAVVAFFRHYKIKDYTRRMEITYNSNKNNFHPHVHSICIIPNDSILNCKTKQKEEFIDKLSLLRKQWHGFLIKAGVEDKSIDYNLLYARPLESIKDILECVKYSVKPMCITPDSVEMFRYNLKNLKLYSGHGIFRIKKENESVSFTDIISNVIEQATFMRDINGYKLISYKNNRLLPQEQKEQL